MTHAPKNDDEKIVFRKVSVAINYDRRYLALTPIPPCGRGLWHHLLFGPHTSQLPGLSLIGRAAMAEELGWEQEDFDKAFAEILDQGLAKADWKLRVLWLPNALKHNLPQSPNVVKSWKRFWDCIPDCELKAEAWAHMKDQLKASPKLHGSLPERSTERLTLIREQRAGRSPTEKNPSQEQQPMEVSSPPRVPAHAHARTRPRAREGCR